MFEPIEDSYKGKERKFLLDIKELFLKLKEDTQGKEAGSQASSAPFYILDDERYNQFFEDLKNLISLDENLWRQNLNLLSAGLDILGDWQPIYGYYSQHMIDIIKTHNLSQDNKFYSFPNPLNLTIELFSYEPVKVSKLLTLKDTNGRVVPLHEQLFNQPGILLKIFESYRPMLMEMVYEREDVRDYLLSREIEGLYKVATDYCYSGFNNYNYSPKYQDFIFDFAQKIDAHTRSPLKEQIKTKLCSWHSDVEMSQKKGFQNLAPEFNPLKPSGEKKFSNIIFKNLIFAENDILGFLQEFLDINKKESYRAIIEKKIGPIEDNVNKVILVNENDLEKIILNYPDSNHNAIVAQEMFNYCWEMGYYRASHHISSAVSLPSVFSFTHYTQGLYSLMLEGEHDDYFYEHLNSLALKARDGQWRGYAGVLDMCFDRCVQRRLGLDDKFRRSHESVETKITGRFGKIDQNRLDAIFDRIDCKTIMPLIVCLFASQPEHLNRILRHGQYVPSDLARALEVIKEIVDIDSYLFLEKNLLEAHIQLNAKEASPTIQANLNNSFKI